MNSTPLVSIGLPVFNEEKYIAEALDALLGQTYTNTEIIISDNGSLDNTLKICREYANKDDRIQIIAHPKNIGARRNFNDLVLHAKGKYFMWAGGHDLWHPTFIRTCVQQLEHNDTAVLAYCYTQWISMNAEKISVSEYALDTRGDSPSDRYKKMLWHINCNLVYGLWRRDSLLQSSLFGEGWGPDILLLAEMAFQGSFIPIKEPLWSRRKNRTSETHQQKKDRILKAVDPDAYEANKHMSIHSLSRQLRGKHFSLIAHSSISFLQKISLYVHTWACFAVRYDVFPGAMLFKKIVKCMLPTFYIERITQWLRHGNTRL